MTPLRVCFLCNEYPPGLHGGIGTMTQLLARTLVRAGHEARVIGVYNPSQPAADFEVDQGVGVWRLRASNRPLGWLLSRHQLFRAISRWSRSGEIDVVEVPDWQGWAAHWPRLPSPVIARLHGSITYFAAELGQPLARAPFWLERASLRRADFWCSVSRYTAGKTRQLFGLRSGPHAILYNPVETIDEDRSPARSRNQVVFTGTLTAKKGIVSLIRAWPRVIEECREAELHIFGKDGRVDDGSSMKAFLLSEQAGHIAKSIHFHGHVERREIHQALQKARVAVFPSYAEAFALAPLEAMASGCPTIYSTRGSGPELIKHGQDGLLVEPDRPDEIAKAIVRVLTEDSLAERLAKSGRERVRKDFSTAALLTQNENFYRSCLEASPRSRGR